MSEQSSVSVQSRLPLLLADPSPCLRWLTLRELLGRQADDPEIQELEGMRESDPLIAGLIAAQAPDGSWQGGPVRATSIALMRLGYLGFGPEHPAVQRGSAFLFAQQREDGAWPLSGGGSETDGCTLSTGYSMVPLQTAIPLRALAACGYATDTRAERAYEWLSAQRLSDGAWPTGIAGQGRGSDGKRGVYGYVAGYRRLAHSRWGCRSNTTGSLICLALHPTRRTGAEARRALDLLLGRETRERQPLGYEVARTVGAEPVRGFLTFYARFDLALVLDLCWRVGATLEDERVSALAEHIWDQQGAFGLWEYLSRPQASRWVSFDLYRSLSRLDESGDWLSAEPRTPFRPYPHPGVDGRHRF